jgi:hypothetical protein
LSPETTREGIVPTQSIPIESSTDLEDLDEETVPPTRPTPPEYQTLASTQDPDADSRPNIPIINDREEANIEVIEGTFAAKPVTPIISDFTRTVEAAFNNNNNNKDLIVASTAFVNSDQVSTTNSTRIRFSIVNKPALVTPPEETRETDARPFSRPILTRPTRPTSIIPTTTKSTSTRKDPTSTTTTTPDTSTTSTLGESFPVRVAGNPFAAGPIKKRPSPFGSSDKVVQTEDNNEDSQEEGEDEVKRKEVINNNINGAIVESIPGNKLTAEELDPETK